MNSPMSDLLKNSLPKSGAFSSHTSIEHFKKIDLASEDPWSENSLENAIPNLVGFLSRKNHFVPFYRSKWTPQNIVLSLKNFTFTIFAF